MEKRKQNNHEKIEIERLKRIGGIYIYIYMRDRGGDE